MEEAICFLFGTLIVATGIASWVTGWAYLLSTVGRDKLHGLFITAVACVVWLMTCVAATVVSLDRFIKFVERLSI